MRLQPRNACRLALVALSCVTPWAGAQDARFLRGDADQNGLVDMTDAVATLGHLFLGNKELACLDAADANDSGQIEIGDPVLTLNFLYLGSAAPPSPGPFDCGSDGTPDAIDCESAEACPPVAPERTPMEVIDPEGDGAMECELAFDPRSGEPYFSCRTVNMTLRQGARTWTTWTTGISLDSRGAAEPCCRATLPCCISGDRGCPCELYEIMTVMNAYERAARDYLAVLERERSPGDVIVTR